MIELEGVKLTVQIAQQSQIARLPNPSNVEIREYRSGDESELSDLIRSSIRELSRGFYPGEVLDNVIKLYSSDAIILSSDSRDIYVGLNGKGEMVGTISLQGDEICSLFVDPRYVRRGIGRTLVDYAEVQANKRGVNKVRLESTVNALAFYYLSDYRPNRIIEDSKYGMRILMEKELKQN